MTALNPVPTIGEQIVETILQHEKIDKTAAKRKAGAVEALETGGYPCRGAPSRRVPAPGQRRRML